MQPRVGDPVGEQQIRREPVLRVRPERLVRARADGRAGRACRRWPHRPAGPGGHRTTRGRPGRGAPPGRTRPAAVRGRRPARRPRSSMSARVREAVWRSSQARVVDEVRPAMSSSARRSPGDLPDGRESAPEGAEVDPRRCVAFADQHEVLRSVDVHAEAPSTLEVPDLVAGELAQPARQRVVAREIGDLRQPVRAGDGDDVRGEAIVGEGDALVRRRGVEEGAPVGGGRQRDGPGPEDDETADPAGPADRQELSKPRPERPPVGRAGDDRHVPGAGLFEASSVALGQRRPPLRHPPDERTRRRVRQRVEDANDDGRHVASLAGAPARLRPPPRSAASHFL